MVNQNWVFGDGAELDFSTNPPSAPNNNRAIGTSEGCSSISDAAGNLLFYTDGMEVWDQNNQLKLSNLLGNSSSTQSSIIVPVPSSTDEYYIITADGSSGGNNHIAATQINITTWASQSILLQGRFSVTNISPTEKVTAIQKENCNDFWLITLVQNTTSGRGTGNGVIRIFSITSAGIIHHSDTDIQEDVHDLGYLKASSNSEKIAFANWRLRKVVILGFDINAGSVDVPSKEIVTIDSVPISFTNPSLGENTVHTKCIYGVEFSPNNQLLYITVISHNVLNGNDGRGYLYQIDLATLIPVLIGTNENNGANYALGALQRDIYNKIYIAQPNESAVGVIHDPNTAGVGVSGANLEWSYITLPRGTRCVMGLPNLLPNPCEGDHDCGCGCAGCNEDAEALNEELIDRAKEKHHLLSSGSHAPFGTNCTVSAIKGSVSLEPDFHFHWGDGANDQIEEHDTEVFYLTVCNHYDDVQFNGLQITKLTLVPDVQDLDKIHIVPDRFIHFNCLTACACQTREFALITRGNDIAGSYELEIEYCFDNISIVKDENDGAVSFPVQIVED